MISKFLQLSARNKLHYTIYYFFSSLKSLKFKIFYLYNLIRLKISDVRIGKNCWIGTSAIILKGVNIGYNCIIGAGSVVVKDVPPNSLAVGVPEKVIKEYNQGSTTSL
jgi:acetyltransferase-like isoleucine patch superfamily enzyme